MKTVEQTKVIEGVEKIEWSKGKDNTFIGALTAAMHAIGEKKKAPDRYENILNSLELAVELANTERFGSYASGFAAYEAWADDLLDASRFIGIDKQEEWLMLINAWCYGSLAHARTEVVTYLRTISKEFDEKTAVHLSKASELYAKITNKLNDGGKYVRFKWQLKDGESWTQEMREAEAGIFKEVSVLEKDATDELKAALELQTTLQTGLR